MMQKRPSTPRTLYGNKFLYSINTEFTGPIAFSTDNPRPYILFWQATFRSALKYEEFPSFSKLIWHFNIVFHARGSIYRSWIAIPKRIGCRRTSIGGFKAVVRKAMEAKARKEVFEQVEKRSQKESVDFKQFVTQLKIAVD